MFDFFKKRKLRSLLQKNNRRRAFLNMEEIRSVLLLFEASDYEVVNLFVKELLGMGKSIDGYVYRTKDNSFDYSGENYVIIGPKENKKKSGEPIEELLKQLKNKHYDVVIDLTIKDNYSLQYILAVADATMTVGLKKNKLPFYDFSISNLSLIEKSEKQQVGELIKSIIHYLKTIRGKTDYCNEQPS